VFADGLKGDKLVETVVLYNPGEQRAEIQVTVYPDDVTTVPRPQVVSVGAGAAERVELFSDANLAAGRHRTVLVSLNDVPFVAERVIAEINGFSSTLPSYLAAPRWWFVDGSSVPGRHEQLVVANPTAVPITMTVRVLGKGGLNVVPGAENLAIDGGKSLVVTLDQLLSGQAELTVVIDATGPVIAERTLRVDGVAGAHRVLGVPANAVPALAPITGADGSEPGLSLDGTQVGDGSGATNRDGSPTDANGPTTISGAGSASTRAPDASPLGTLPPDTLSPGPGSPGSGSPGSGK
jgi:hypothetical protein